MNGLHFHRSGIEQAITKSEYKTKFWRIQWDYLMEKKFLLQELEKE